MKRVLSKKNLAVVFILILGAIAVLYLFGDRILDVRPKVVNYPKDNNGNHLKREPKESAEARVDAGIDESGGKNVITAEPLEPDRSVPAGMPKGISEALNTINEVNNINKLNMGLESGKK